MTDERPLVSAVVPTYGRDADLFERAIRSVAAQTYDRIELIVVDDSPIDVDLPRPADCGLSEAFERVGWIDDRDHDGPAAARNRGMNVSRGSLIAFLDDDDRWLPPKVERQVRRFNDGPDRLGLVCTGLENVDERSRVVGRRRPRLEGDVATDLLVGRPLVSFSAVMVRAVVPETVGGIDERLRMLEDREWYLRIAERYHVGSITDVLTVRTRGSHEQLSDDWEQLRDVTYPILVEKHRDRAAAYGWYHERRFIAWVLKTVGGVGILTGHYQAGRKYLLRSIRYYPFASTPWTYLLFSLGGGRPFRAAQWLKRRLVSTLS